MPERRRLPANQVSGLHSKEDDALSLLIRFTNGAFPPREKKKWPFRLRSPKEDTLLLAGLWDEWEGAKGCLRTFAILTTEANESVRVLHNRMPVIFSPQASNLWLGEGFDQAEFLKRIAPDLQPALTVEAAILPSSQKPSGGQKDLFTRKG